MHLSIFQNTASDVDIHTHIIYVQTLNNTFWSFTISHHAVNLVSLSWSYTMVECFHLLLLLFSLKTVFDLFAFITFFPQLIQLTLSRLMNFPFLYFRVSTVSSVPISPHTHTHINTHRARACTHAHTHTYTHVRLRQITIYVSSQHLLGMGIVS